MKIPFVRRTSEHHPAIPGYITWYRSERTAFMVAVCGFSPSGTIWSAYFRIRSKEIPLKRFTWGFYRDSFDKIRRAERETGARLGLDRLDDFEREERELSESRQSIVEAS